jgi:ABC-type nitrate/sulfonate/bicarbonate transport system ATPase subunit
VIALQDVHFSFASDLKLFEGFSMTFEAGKTTALLGPSGCGKSTLVRLICGLLSPSSGHVSVATQQSTEAGRVRGVLFQDDTLIPWLTCAQNAVFPNHSDTCSEVNTRARRLLEAVELGHALSQLPHELSAGMKKRLEFVRALLADDAFLVADEPFTALDFHQKRQLWRLWREQMAEGQRTGVIVTHDPAEAVALADRIIVISSSKPVQVILDKTTNSEADRSDAEAQIIAALLASSERSGLTGTNCV